MITVSIREMYFKVGMLNVCDTKLIVRRNVKAAFHTPQHPDSEKFLSRFEASECFEETKLRKDKIGISKNFQHSERREKTAFYFVCFLLFVLLFGIHT